MDYRVEYSSNLAAGAKADAAAVRELRTELEAVAAALGGLEKARGPAVASPAGPAAGGYGGAGAGAGSKASPDKPAQKAPKPPKLAGNAVGTVAGGARMALGAAGAAAGLAGVAGIARLAMGYKGMAQLQAITYRTSVQARQLFKGVDSAPAVRAADRFMQSIFSPMSVAGKALQGIFTRVGNSIFGGLERAQPLATAFFKGMIIGALEIEGAYYDLRLALLPVTEAIGDMIGPTDQLKVSAGAGAIAVGALGIAATGAAAPFVTAAAAVGELLVQIRALREEWGAWGEGRQLIRDQLREDLGLESQRQRDAKAAAPSEGESGAGMSDAEVKAFLAKRREMLAADDGTSEAQRAAGQAAGSMYAAGVIEGADAGSAAAAAAGERVAGAVDKGFRRKAQIHSPSKLAEKSASYLPAGTVAGIDKGAPAVQAAAERSLVPKMPGGGATPAATGAPGAAPVQISLVVHVQVQGEGGGAGGGGGAASMASAASAAFGAEARAFFLSLGMSPTLGGPAVP